MAMVVVVGHPARKKIYSRLVSTWYRIPLNRERRVKVVCKPHWHCLELNGIDGLSDRGKLTTNVDHIFAKHLKMRDALHIMKTF